MHHAAPLAASFEAPSQTSTGEVSPTMLGGALSTSGPVAPSRTAWPQIVFLFTYWGLGKFLNVNGVRLHDHAFRTPKVIPIMSTYSHHSAIRPTASSAVPLPSTSARFTHRREPQGEHHHVKVDTHTEEPYNDHNVPTVSLHPSTGGGFSTVTDTGWVDHGGGRGSHGKDTIPLHSIETPQLTVLPTVRQGVSQLHIHRGGAHSGGGADRTGRQQITQPHSRPPGRSVAESNTQQEVHNGGSAIDTPGDTAMLNVHTVDPHSTKLSTRDFSTRVELQTLQSVRLLISRTDVVATSAHHSGSQLWSATMYDPSHGRPEEGAHDRHVRASQTNMAQQVGPSKLITSDSSSNMHSTDSDDIPIMILPVSPSPSISSLQTEHLSSSYSAFPDRHKTGASYMGTSLPAGHIPSDRDNAELRPSVVLLSEAVSLSTATKVITPNLESTSLSSLRMVDTSLAASNDETLVAFSDTLTGTGTDIGTDISTDTDTGTDTGTSTVTGMGTGISAVLTTMGAQINPTPVAEPLATALQRDYSSRDLVMPKSTELTSSLSEQNTSRRISLVGSSIMTTRVVPSTEVSSQSEVVSMVLSQRKADTISRTDVLPTELSGNLHHLDMFTTETASFTELSKPSGEILESSSSLLDYRSSNYYTCSPAPHPVRDRSTHPLDSATVYPTHLVLLTPNSTSYSSFPSSYAISPSSATSSPSLTAISFISTASTSTSSLSFSSYSSSFNTHSSSSPFSTSFFSSTSSPSSSSTSSALSSPSSSISPFSSSISSITISPSTLPSYPAGTLHAGLSTSAISTPPLAAGSTKSAPLHSGTGLPLPKPTSVMPTAVPSIPSSGTQWILSSEDQTSQKHTTPASAASKLANQQDSKSSQIGPQWTGTDRHDYTPAGDRALTTYNALYVTASNAELTPTPASTATTEHLSTSTLQTPPSQPSTHTAHIQTSTPAPRVAGSGHQVEMTLVTRGVRKVTPSPPGGDWSKKSGDPFLTKPVKAWTVKGRTSSSGQQITRTTSFAISTITSPMTLTAFETPSVYVTMELRMSWTDFCACIDEFKRVLLSILGQSTHDNYQLVVMPAEECGNVYNVARRSAEISVDVYIADIKGQYNLQMTSKFARRVNRRVLDETPGAFKGKFLRVYVVEKAKGTTPMTGLVSEEREPIGGLSTAIVIGIALAAVSATLIVTLIVAQLVIIGRRRAVKKMRVVSYDSARPSIDVHSLEESVQMISMASLAAVRLAYTNPALDSDDSKDYTSNPLSLVALQELFMEPDSEDIEDEFLMLPNPMPKLCEVPDGVEDKNRYANVIPIRETRVPLMSTSGGEHPSYINANFVRGYGGANRMYIATQAPMENTRFDFWEMVWQQQSQVILMLTGIEENGQSKCVNYWPNTEGSDIVRIYGDYHVQLQQRDVAPFWIRSTLLLKNMETNLCREVQHLWLTTWPPSGVPEDPGVVLAFLEAARPYMESSHGPTVVHCSPGTGRTGTLLAIDIGVWSWRFTHTVDVLQTVRQLRQDRAGAIQTKGQYEFVYKALLEYAIGVSNPSCSSSMTSSFISERV